MSEELSVGKTVSEPPIEVVLVDGEKEIRIRCHDDEDFSRIMDMLAMGQQVYEREVAQQYGVSPDTAAAIAYLRSRSRWTEEKEMELVSRDRGGNPIPLRTVLSGEF